MKILRDRVVAHIGFLTIEIYIPNVINNSDDIGIYLDTQVSYKKFNKHNAMWFYRAGVVRLFGFGIGFAWKHCDNPNFDYEICNKEVP